MRGKANGRVDGVGVNLKRIDPPPRPPVLYMCNEPARALIKNKNWASKSA